jgi:DNA-binding HxlR family transcriptional regulator
MYRKVTIVDNQGEKISIMAKKTSHEKHEEQCTVDYAFQRIGGKYKGRLIWALKSGVMRYGALKRYVTGITAKMLTQALRELEEDGLVTRVVYHEVPPRVEYELTKEGRELVPFIEMLSAWAEKQMSIRGIPSMTKTEAQKRRGLAKKAGESAEVMSPSPA